MTRRCEAAAAAVPSGGRERHCSVGRTLAILSDAWSFLVLREAYLGARRFGDWLSVLRLPRATLAERLERLTAAGLLRRVPYSTRPPREEYRLTEAGVDLYIVMLSLMRFGDQYLSADRKPPLQLIHATCGADCTPLTVCSRCRAAVEARAVRFRDGPGAGAGPPPDMRRVRRAGEAAAFERGRPSSVARALAAVGDRWSFLVLREAFFGVRRFDALHDGLGIAPNVLADRLARLVAQGLLARAARAPDAAGGARHDYRLTAMGHALYLPMIHMLRWGDRWLAPDGPPLILTHRSCGCDFVPLLVCDGCAAPLHAHDMRYRLRYANPLPAAAPALLR